MTKNNTLESLTKDSSISYELGVTIAAVIVILLAFASITTVAQSTLVILLAGFILIGGGTAIDREPHYAMIAPFIFQLALLRFLEPYDSNPWLTPGDGLINLYVGMSALLATVQYAWLNTVAITEENKHYIEPLRLASLYTMVVAPASIFIFAKTVLLMPLALLLAAGVFLYHYRNERSEVKEATGYVAVAAIFWFMAFKGVENIQAYTHILALLFALYAYLRLRKGDARGDDYLLIMLGISTIPLALETLSGGANADIYGVLLLLENVGFLILGVTIQKSVVIRWGLYTAVASVVYQLRELGWAMLSVVALFVIGVAIHRALKQPDNER
jgi:hypothetical protein